jgi:hypothetical protein
VTYGAGTLQVLAYDRDFGYAAVFGSTTLNVTVTF